MRERPVVRFLEVIRDRDCREVGESSGVEWVLGDWDQAAVSWSEGYGEDGGYTAGCSGC